MEHEDLYWEDKIMKAQLDAAKDLVPDAEEVVNPDKVTPEDPEGDGLKNDGKATTAATQGDVLGI